MGVHYLRYHPGGFWVLGLVRLGRVYWCFVSEAV